ncbi:MAG: NADH-quinone oxidoreductase subunit H, partial [Bacteroidales bacterium]|nr:NADH-quinone oxidoreductase subunit H [Bacteroidales bacterium]
MLSFLLIIVAALFFNGLIIRTKSMAAGRKGPGLLQPLKDVCRLFKKGAVYSTNSTFIFRLAPLVYFASLLMACACIPFGDKGGLISFDGDFVFFAYILALGKFFCIIAAMDVASSFEGMGASREALYSMLAEPAFFLFAGTMALISGHTSFASMFAEFDTYLSLFHFGIAIALTFILLTVTLIENSRLPLDDPKTHLELTMIHEVMILDNSGFDLGLILSAGYLKFAMYGAIIANLFLYGSTAFSILIFFVVQAICAVAIGCIESFMARSRMN